MSPPAIKLFVTDTGPLITLAAGDSLDYLLLLDLEVVVPDAVVYEATREIGALGARQIVDWVQARANRIRVVPTSSFADAIEMMRAGLMPRSKDLGERAALEAIEGAGLGVGAAAMLLTEDDKVFRRLVSLPDSAPSTTIPISTRDFLEMLERERLINSADEVYRRAEDAGRFASRRKMLDAADERARAAVATLLKRP
jgi:hypothetical protein